MTKAALLLQAETSGSVAMIFFTRATIHCQWSGSAESLPIEAIQKRYREAGCVQGKETVPVTSLEGAMGVLL